MAEPGDGRIVLASASPRRLALLRLAGIEPLVRPVDLDETARAGEDPLAYVERLAREKAAAATWKPRFVLAADTAVVVDGEALGKPEDADDAAAMLRRLAGRSHTVATGVAVAPDEGRTRSRVVTTTVVMAPLSDAAIAHYVSTGEPLDKAGGYAIQGRAAAFVERIDGSWTNVVGLPLVETIAMLEAAGWERPHPRKPPQSA